MTITQTRPTLSAYVRRLNAIATLVQAIDSDGVDYALRLTVSHRLYFAYDHLRCQERPFDRQAFAQCLALVEQMLKAFPRLRGRWAEHARPQAEEPERVVSSLYSQCWSHYDDRVFLQTVELFKERFELNGVSLDFFQQSIECLDAGCGSGRYAIAMAQLGARSVIGLDLSDRAIREATERSRRLGLADIVHFRQGSAIAMPKEWTEKFDFVCSNGVLHHTTDPMAGLEEIFRVLKPGGRAYIYVYGAGGLLWELEDVVRELVAPVPMAVADLWLQQWGLPPGKMFNAMDHWYTPIRELLTKTAYEARLSACGFRRLVYMPRANIYDSSERRCRFPEERDLIGEGDLRYLVEKPARPAQRRQAVHTRSYGSA